jgi:GNAT superfamily N-acetyltransferase
MPTSAADLGNDWLDGTGRLTPERLDRIFAIAARDAEVKPLLDEALARMGRGSRETLRSRFTLCAEGDAPGLAGKTFMRQEQLVVAKGEGWAAEVQKATHTDDLMDARVTDGVDYAVVERWVIPRICMQPQLPLGGAVEALVHELTHALKRDPRRYPVDLATPTDEAHFQIATVQLPGDEVDAYATASRARVRLDGGTAGVLPPLRPSFDAQGRLIGSRESLARAIVASAPQGLGYGDGMLRHALAEARAAESSTLESKRRLLATFADLRHDEQAQLVKIIATMTANVGIHETNIGIAQQRRDAALEAKFKKARDDEKKKLDETKALLAASQASEQRVRAEIPQLEARIAKLR